MGPRRTVNGREMTHEVRIILAEKAWLEVEKKKQSVSVSPSDKGAVFEIMLEHGHCQIQGWFSDANDVDLCGAFYARMTRL